jgi:hypothetical protein
MSPIEKLKAEAVALQEKARSLGRVLKHAAALEQIAKNHGFRDWRACKALLEQKSPSSKPPVGFGKLARYESSEWNFALDVPDHWNRFPTVPTNSPNEVVRFASQDEGLHLLIIFRHPYDPKRTLQDHSDRVQVDLSVSVRSETA